MFGFSPGKILFLLLVFLVVWYGWKFARRVDLVRRSLQQEMERQRNAASPGVDGRGRGGGGRNLPAEDLVKCRICGAYVAPQGTSPCGRADCPWTRAGAS